MIYYELYTHFNIFYANTDTIQKSFVNCPLHFNYIWFNSLWWQYLLPTSILPATDWHETPHPVTLSKAVGGNCSSMSPLFFAALKTALAGVDIEVCESESESVRWCEGASVWVSVR